MEIDLTCDNPRLNGAWRCATATITQYECQTYCLINRTAAPSACAGSRCGTLEFRKIFNPFEFDAEKKICYKENYNPLVNNSRPPPAVVAHVEDVEEVAEEEEGEAHAVPQRRLVDVEEAEEEHA